MVAFSFYFFFLLSMLKEAKARASIPIRALYLLKSDFFNFNLFLAFYHSLSTILKFAKNVKDAYA